MKVTNTGPKILGFGLLHIAPGETKELPAGFGAEHPTVKFFLGRGWLTQTSDGGVLVPSGTTSGEDPPEGDLMQMPLTSRNVSRMRLEQLREVATNLELSWVEADTRAVLIEQITAKLSETDEQR